MTLARNAFALLDRTTESHAGDRTAYGFEGEVRTFREMRDASLEVAAGLAANGVGRGDKVAVMMGNRFEWVETFFGLAALGRSEEHTSELQSLMRISYAVFCLKKKTTTT